MKKILITDTHFGNKNNSSTWLKSQMRFMYDTLLSYIKTLKKEDSVELYHLGDLFDSRSTINTYIASSVIDLFKELSKHVNITIICGNHDFYSPDSDSINSISILLKDIDNITIVDKDILIKGCDMFIPWYKWIDKKEIRENLKRNNIKNVFCHTDIVYMDDEYKDLLKDVYIYSGHIHTPFFKDNRFNIGSTFANTFSDANSRRGCYVLDDSNKLSFIENDRSIRFWRIYNEELLQTTDKINNGDYIELYIKDALLRKTEYSNIIEQLKNKTKHCYINAISDIQTNYNIDFEKFDIDSICEKIIPDYLLQKFSQIKN